MQIANGRVGTYSYVVRDAEGAVIDATPADRPFVYLHGISPVLPAVQDRLEGREPGERLAFTLPPAEALGERDPSLVHVIDRASWETGEEPVPGPISLQVRAESGEVVQITGRIVAVDEAMVTLDRNHPLAGKTLDFALEVLAVREATADETARQMPLPFPFDVMARRDFPGEVGDLLRQFRTLCMVPPFPWGHWQVARLFEERCAALPGQIAELGVGLGGTSLFLASLAEGRTVYALDTFEGLPAPDPLRDNAYFVEGLYRGRTPLLERFTAAATRHALDDRVVAVPGRFADTLPTLPDDLRLCFAHLDSDLYDSVHASLEGVWDRMVQGGVVVVDDFLHPAQGPRRACADFFAARGLRPPHHLLFPYAVFFVKGEPDAPRAARSLDGNAWDLAFVRGDHLLRETVAGARDRLHPGSRPHANAARLHDLLVADTPRTSDLYAYQRALEDFWDTIAAGFFEVTPI